MNYTLFILIIIFSSIVSAQNADIQLKYFSGSGQSMAGVGIASQKYNSSFDINPANLILDSYSNISVSSKYNFYDYKLLRNTKDVVNQDYGSQVGTIKWNEKQFVFSQFSFQHKINDKLYIGLGLFEKLNPYVSNSKIAATFSELYKQKTDGLIYARAISFAYRFSSNFLFGLTYYNYWGTIKSEIVGNRHGLDSDKFAELKSKINGYNFRIGACYKKDNFNFGIVLEPNMDLIVNYNKNYSADAFYKNLLPINNSVKLNLPFVIAAGISYSGIENWMLEINYDYRKYNSTTNNFNVFEFGGNPEKVNINNIRLGIMCNLFRIPIFAGYSYSPQLYFSNNSIGSLTEINSYENTNQIVKHSFTLGTTYKLNKVGLDFSIKYSKLSWERRIIIPQIIDDEYNENTLSLFSTIRYKF